MKIVKSLKNSGLLRKDVCETNENKAGAKDRFLSIPMATLGASLLGNILVGEGTIRAGQDFWCSLILGLILKYEKYYQKNLGLTAFI